ncbi:MAG: lipoyl domain-containing protein [Candidatus Bipolaricaulota bacterium]|jgi:pyruvate/2-oxoglutarate dehydrogenase complex dihydrolipoamide acyltransferase (E2) component
MTEVCLPDLGEISEVTVVGWLRQEGETIVAGEGLVEVETEKTTFVVEAPQDGKLALIVKKKGDKARINELLARIS